MVRFNLDFYIKKLGILSNSLIYQRGFLQVRIWKVQRKCTKKVVYNYINSICKGCCLTIKTTNSLLFSLFISLTEGLITAKNNILYSSVGGGVFFHCSPRTT